MNACIVCGSDTAGYFCEPCGRSYERAGIPDGGSEMDAIRWAADRAARLRGVARRRGGGVSIFVHADEIAMLHDRVLSGWEQSEEPGWEELLSKVERARSKLSDARKGGGV